MFPFIWLVVSVVFVLKNSRNVWWVYIVTSMWINYDVRAGSFTLLNILSFLIIFIAYKKRKNSFCVLSPIFKLLSKLLLYIVLTNIFVTILSTGPLIANLMSMKATMLSWLFCYGMLYIMPNCKTVGYESVMTSFLIMLLYGVFAYVTSSNPYSAMISEYMSDNIDLESLMERSMEDARGALQGRITGTSPYSIQYAILVLLVTCLMLGINMKEDNKIMFVGMIILAFINVYLTGSRGVLVAFFMVLLFYYSHELSNKRKWLVLTFFLLIGILFSKYINLYLGSLMQEDVGGSNFDMRIMQVYGAYLEIQGSLQSLLFGRGYYFVPDYLQNHGPHPLSLCFESTLSYGLATYGILGLIFIFLGTEVIMWRTVYSLYKKCCICKKAYYATSSLIIAHFIYGVLVGNAYGSLYMVIYIIIIQIGYYTSRSSVANMKNENLKLDNIK